jgi:G3E family GTPase
MTGPLPVTVVTGFLGAGKTTLVNGWLGDEAPGQVAVIVNEHGTIGIDGELLRERVRDLREITGGCVCCSNRAELVQALDELTQAAPRPERVLIETSGAASPAGVLRTLAAGERREAFALDGVVTVVDASRTRQLLERELALEQLGYADLIVLSRADLLSQGELERAEALLGTRNESATFVHAARGKVLTPAVTSLRQLLGLRRSGSFSTPVGVASDHGDYQSVSMLAPVALDGDRFAEFMEEEVARFAGRIFRVKGIIAIQGLDARLIVQGVADAVEVSVGEPWGAESRTSRLVVVGFGLDADALRRGFDACR